MKDVTIAKGLSELRTATTHHIAAKPPRKGTDYLDLYALSMEKQRLETELARLEKRQKRVYERVAEIHKGMERLLEAAARIKEASSSPMSSTRGQETGASQQNDRSQWKRIPVDY